MPDAAIAARNDSIRVSGIRGSTAHRDGLCVRIWTVSIPSAAAASTALKKPPETDI